MSTSTQELPDCDIRFTAGIAARVIILRMNKNVLTTLLDGEYQGWSPRLVRRAFKREIFDASDIALWSEIVEGTVECPIQLDEIHQLSYDRLMQHHARLSFKRLDLRRWSFHRPPPLWSRVTLTLVRPAGRRSYGQRIADAIVRVYHAPVGDIYPSDDAYAIA